MIEQKNNIFHLTTKNSSYVFQILQNNVIEHVYYGRRLVNPFMDIKALQTKASSLNKYNNYIDSKSNLCLDLLPRELTTEGKGDYKTPSCTILDTKTFNKTLDFKFTKYQEKNGIVRFSDTLPQAIGSETNCQNLIISLLDNTQDLELELIYTIFPEADVITKRTILKNTGTNEIVITESASSVLDFSSSAFTLKTFDGEKTITNGKTVFETCSNYAASPLLVLEKNNGECYYLNLIYSGATQTTVEKTDSGLLHIVQGVNFSVNQLTLKKDESFESPEAVLSYNPTSYSKLKDKIDFFINNHIVRGLWKNRIHPVIFNTRATFPLRINENKFSHIITDAKELGAEMIVLDDLWFAVRSIDGNSLGDWSVNTQVLPSGIAQLAAEAHQNGLLFGLWFAPQAISAESLLYKKHPDWIISKPNCSSYQNQYILDLTKEDVFDYLLKVLTTYAETNKVDYIKWDFNSIISDYSQTKDSAYLHSYMKAVYKLQKSIKTRCPQLMLENSSNGHHIDLGTFCYMTQITQREDATLDFLSNFNSVYPPALLCTEITKLSSFNYKLFGSICYSLDFLSLKKEDKDVIKKQIDFYKTYRAILQFGSFKRESTSEFTLLTATNPENSVVIAMLQPLSDNATTLKITSVQENYNYEVFPPFAEKGCEEFYQVNGDTLKWAGIKLQKPLINRPTIYIIKKI